MANALQYDDMKSFVCKLAIGVFVAILTACDVRAEGTAGTNIVITGPMADLNQAAAAIGFKDKMPARLCSFLWPDYATTNKCLIKKIQMAGKEQNEQKMLIVRMDNRDLIFASIMETKTDYDSKIRREYYYRVTPGGDLALALKVTFQFRVTDTDTDILSNMSLQTYSDAVGSGGTKPITPEVKAHFEAEKKLWLSQKKKLKKQEEQMDK